MTNINSLLPAAPEGYFWRIFERKDDGYLMLQLREGNEKKSKDVYTTSIANSATNLDILDSLITDTGRFVLKYAFPEKRDWSNYVGDYGIS